MSPTVGSFLTRNTPTGVGKTHSIHLPQSELKKHPHGRGEDWGHVEMCLYTKETPPRAWGRLGAVAVEV